MLAVKCLKSIESLAFYIKLLFCNYKGMHTHHVHVPLWHWPSSLQVCFIYDLWSVFYIIKFLSKSLFCYYKGMHTHYVHLCPFMALTFLIASVLFTTYDQSFTSSNFFSKLFFKIFFLHYSYEIAWHLKIMRKNIPEINDVYKFRKFFF